MPVNTPSEVADPVAAVTGAENEAVSLDILVCGNCQSVFHFVEEFQEHKTRNDCEKADKTALSIQGGSKKPQVWAFLIWKNSQQKVAVNDQQGSWKLYQKWCNMPESQRQSWVTAGRNIQAFINLSHARDASKLDNTNRESDKEQDDEIEEEFVVEKIVGKRYNPKKKQYEYLLKWEGYPSDQNTWEPLSNLTTCKTLLQEYEKQASQSMSNRSPMTRLSGVLRKDTSLTPVKLQTVGSPKPSGLMPTKFTPTIEKKNENAVLQTQRKIVPAMPSSNSTSITRLSTPVFSRTPDTNKFLTKAVDEAKDASFVKSPAISPVESKSSPPKKRIFANVTPDETKSGSVPASISALSSKPDLTVTRLNSTDVSTTTDEPSLKRTLDPLNTNDDAKRIKGADEQSSTLQKSDTEETIDIPKSGIFRKCDLREKYPSINSIFGRPNEEEESTKTNGNNKNNTNAKGVLKVDHSQMAEMQSGIYRMKLEGDTARVDLLSNDKSLSVTLPAVPGPKGGVLVLSDRLDASKIATNKSNATLADRSKILSSSGLTDNGTAKKPFSPATRKVIGTPSTVLNKGKVRGNLNMSMNRFKTTTFLKSFNDSVSDSLGSRLGDSDGPSNDFCENDNSEPEEYAMPDDFPDELNMEPLSPSRPLTLDPETGKRLMRAEGEPTPEPTPEPSPVPSPTQNMKQEQDIMTKTDNILGGDGTEETYAQIDGSTYKVTSAGQVGLLHNATYTQSEDGLSIAAGIDGEEPGDGQNVLTITGEDGLVYQVANAKIEGDTIVVASGEEDQQQCVFVTSDGHQVIQRTNEDGSTVLTLESAYTDAAAQLVPNQVNILPDGSHIYVKQDENGQVELVQLQNELAEQEPAEEPAVPAVETPDENSGQVVAQLIEAGEPAPGGGPRRVVLLLPDGNLMVTEVDEEQFAALELEK